ncbi:hypothetical protein AB0A77_27170 [Streptomyces varsoviensis]|uniref:hypothetical protein n=1 Tax=Streptomyces varsoviensis TaxID=67373 RepID=UPI0034117944
MSGYKALVKAYWETYRPNALAALAETTPGTFFAQVSEEIEELIAEYRDDYREEYREETPPGTDFRVVIGYLNMATMRARERALHEMVYGLAKEPGTEDKEMPEVSLPKITAG